ncbi:MAG: hypothetical protein QM699_07600 [Amaricoccus sp.]|uniref:hypothetical protein n=1 Tax=Amaricoccus sp. TaxID=1872485 RepID=UPI0039E26105
MTDNPLALNPLALISKSSLRRLEAFAADRKIDAGCVAAAVVEDWVRRVQNLHLPASEVSHVVDRAKHVKGRQR